MHTKIKNLVLSAQILFYTKSNARLTKKNKKLQHKVLKK